MKYAYCCKSVKIMEIRFEDEKGDIVKKTTENIFIPNKGDLILIDTEMFEVNYRYINYDKNIIEIDMERQ